MLSPSWLAAAAGDANDRQCFYAEVARRLGLPRYEVSSAQDPLAAWVAVESVFARLQLLQDLPANGVQYRGVAE